MKNLLLPILLVFSTAVFAQTPCSGGSAGPYPCDGYNLQSTIDLSTMNAGGGNDSWGWTDPSNGNEYALIGLNNGTAFIDISDPVNPVYLGKLPTQTSNSSWRDIKVYSNYVFVVSEANGHGMQVFDLTRLRNVTNPPETFTTDAHYSGFGSAHNIVINEESGYAYGVGTNSYNGGPHFVNIQNPLNPVGEGGYSMDNYSHDAQVVTYCGPDNDYIGREILIGSNENEVVIVDITNKANPQGIATLSYTNVGYTHQGWFTEDQRFFIVGDELDESNIGFNTRTIIFDFEDLDNPEFHFEYFGPTPAIDHNGYVKGNKYYIANYRAGMRVIDITDIENGNIVEEGSFDTYPANNNTNFSGAWNVYPYFESGNIVISDINRGFFLVRAQNTDTVKPTAVCTDITIALDTDGQAIIEASDLDNGSSDNSGTVYFNICDDTFDCSDLGANSVQLEVYDAFGNKDYCTSTVTVIDDLDPTVSCPANSTSGYDPGENYYTVPDYVANGDVNAQDNCASGLTIAQDPAPGTQLSMGTYTIEFEAEDASGNTANCSFELTVVEILSTTDQEFETGLVLFPNPVSETLNIVSRTLPIDRIVLTDILGQTIFSEEYGATGEVMVNMANLAKGIYFVSVNESVTKKIIKN